MAAPKTKATILDIAGKLNVTPSTVSRALNGHAAISEATKRAVIKTAKRLNYHPNQIASSLRLGTSKIIGVIIPSAEINFFGAVVHGIEKVASEKGYNVLLYQSNELLDFEKRGIATFLRSRVEGVFASLSKETTELDHFKSLKKRGVPLLLFDRASDDLGVPSIVIDDYKGAYMATTHLLSQGCRCVAHIAGPQHIHIFKERLNGYRDALRHAGLTPRDQWITYGTVSVDSGRRCMRELLATSPGIDGVFAVEDFTALGALQCLKEEGKKVPDEICLVGFANEAFGEYITPSLSTVNQQTIRMGEEATKLFFSLIKQKNFYKSPVPKVVLEPELIVRDTSRRKKEMQRL
ncbi:MAG TPA: LacI family DNA-binding transcriptional regulator [Flavisolibacter sp.]|jgi:LacI family transcriptional regulator|nr:LacI family DNA-binding transcriptional regulator [Flavisolibacter sp.]